MCGSFLKVIRMILNYTDNVGGDVWLVLGCLISSLAMLTVDYFRIGDLLLCHYVTLMRPFIERFE